MSIQILLNSILIDIVEIVIVKSKDYTLFETLKYLFVKLQEPSRVSRINDKLTIVTLSDSNDDDYHLNSELNHKAHREYDKPYFIKYNGYSVWRKYGLGKRRDDLPDDCCTFGGRIWRKEDYKLCRDNGNPAHIYMGEHYWFSNGNNERENNLPLWISLSGYRLLCNYNGVMIYDSLQ